MPGVLRPVRPALPPWQLCLLAGLSLTLVATPPVRADVPPRPPAVVPQPEPSHAALDSLLQAVVQNGRVNYALLKTRLPELNAYIKSLADLSPERVKGLTPPQQLALYLNAYNARVLQEIASAWPIKSIMDIPGVFKTRTFVIAGRTLTLDQLENDIIRKQFREPKVHVGLNCGAVSCPPIPTRAFTGESVYPQLEQAMRAFLRRPEGVQVEVATGTVTLSRIFEWFASDFASASRTATARPPLSLEQTAVLDYILPFWEDASSRKVLAGSPRVVYREYNWSVNAQ